MPLDLNQDQVFAFGLLMATFMLLALPFAAALLVSWVRTKLSDRQRLLILLLVMFVAPAALAVIVPSLVESDYLKFIHKDQAYYAQVSQACEDLIHRHPLGTNEFRDISVTDSSIPTVLRKLHPSDVSVSADGLHLRMHKGSRLGYYAVSWIRDEDITNIWRLQAGGGEAPVVVVYKRTNRRSSN